MVSMKKQYKPKQENIVKLAAYLNTIKETKNKK